MASVYNMFLYFLWFEICIGNHYEVTIINQFYSIWDTHSSINELLTLLCHNKFSFNIHGNASQLIDHYQQYIKSHTNEHHYIYNIISQQSLTDLETNEYLIYIEYNTLQWNNHKSHTLCNHYNYTVKMNITNYCIQSIQTPFKILGIFIDHNSTLCSYVSDSHISHNYKIKTLQLNAVNLPAYNITFMDFSNPKQYITGSIASFIWTLLFIIYHLSLLNYPSIYHTKTAVFTVFLTSFANITLATHLNDIYSFFPNAISIILTMVHFSSWAYHMKVNIDSKSIINFITFNRSERKQIIHKTTDNNLLSSNRNKKQLKQRLNMNIQNSDTEEDISMESEPSPTPQQNSLQNSLHNDEHINSLYKHISKPKLSYHPYRGRHPRYQFMTDSKFVKIFFMIFVMLSMLTHFIISFICYAFNTLDRFNFFSTLVLFQWELAIELLLYDGYSLNYLLGIQAKKNENKLLLENIYEEEMNVLNNDKHLLSPTPPNPYQYNQEDDLISNNTNISSSFSSLYNRKTRGSIHLNDGKQALLYTEINMNNKSRISNSNSNNKSKSVIISNRDASLSFYSSGGVSRKEAQEQCVICCDKYCCFCLRNICILLLKLGRYLPIFVLLNSLIWIYFGMFIIGIEVIYLQHSISAMVSLLYLICSFFMNEKHVILEQESTIPMRCRTLSQNNSNKIDNDNEFNYVGASIAFKQRHQININNNNINNNYQQQMQSFELARDRSQTERDYRINGDNVSVLSPYSLNTITFKPQ